VLKRTVENPLDAHELLREGLPAKALTALIDHVGILRSAAGFEKAVGMSQRTLHRRKDDADRPLSTEQSGRTWKFAEIVAKAISVFGSQEEAEAWLLRPATGLNQRSPLELLETTAGAELVEEHLGRMEYGVYA
jgi:putative toxin-antitoxin system antitoxin component (TIGR02293 family)